MALIAKAWINHSVIRRAGDQDAAAAGLLGVRGAHVRRDRIDQFADGTHLQGVTKFLEWIARGPDRQALFEAANRFGMQCGHQRHVARGGYQHLRKARSRGHLRNIGDMHHPEVALI